MPLTLDDLPVVDVKWIAGQVGLAPSTVRRYITERNPRLISDVHDTDGAPIPNWFSRERAAEWIAAYKSAPKRGRRGDGSVRRKGRNVK